MDVRVVSDEAAELGEGPRWDAGRGELLWVDILGPVVRRARVGAEGRLDTVAAYDVDVPVGAATPVAGPEGGWLLAAGTGFRHLGVDGAVRTLAQPEAGRDDVRMNDAACDPAGRLWAGTMAYDGRAGAGTLYRVGLDGSVAAVLRGRTICNGLGWSPDGATLYFADSGEATVTAYAYDLAGGELGPGRELLRLDPGTGVPDGLTVDAEGAIWVAVHGAGEVRRHDPDGALVSRVRLPVSQPTSVCIGGPDGRTLFVTSAREGLSEEQLRAQPAAGRVLALPVDVGAPPVAPYAGVLPR